MEPHSNLPSEINLNPEPGRKGGIVFIRTNMLDSIKSFYMNEAGCDLWLEQAHCVILRHGNQLIGFCQADQPDMDGLLTFFYSNREYVDEMYRKLGHLAENPPMDNPKYLIYHFYAKDPEGRRIEFQWFSHEVPEY